MESMRKMFIVLAAVLSAETLAAAPAAAQQKPNLIMIMDDDLGWYSVGAYHQTPDGSQ